ncbi:MAG: diacylglycerol O-acyltransferase / trehalose O-mycolyltransferase [Solirubrobacteraceae bacterium]|nr:diacylglycerol O-acyltransferase / trehalose O-mycolyltransferase [Solirubrobacteraceae bacterium]
MRRVALLAAGGLLALAPAALASGPRLVTWTTHSRYVDPATQNFNRPPGVAPRPNRLRVNILLPPGYDAHRHSRYPVLYLLHGHGDAFDSWLHPRNGDLRHTAPNLGAIVVMPDGARGWYTNWWNGGARGRPGWERYHLDELMPLVDRRLRIRRGRRWHAIAGLSMGGEGAAYYAAQRPGYFGSVGTFSGTVSILRLEWPTGFETQGEHFSDVYGDPSAQRFYIAGHDPTSLAANLRYTRVFVAVGDGVPDPSSADQLKNTFGQVAERDLRMHADDFVAATRAAGASVTYHPQQGIHDWPYWRRHLQQALQWGFFRPVVEHPHDWSFSTVSSFSRAWNVNFHFDAAPDRVETFTRHGSRLRGAGSGVVRLGIGRRRRTLRLPFDVRAF